MVSTLSHACVSFFVRRVINTMYSVDRTQMILPSRGCFLKKKMVCVNIYNRSNKLLQQEIHTREGGTLSLTSTYKAYDGFISI